MRRIIWGILAAGCLGVLIFALCLPMLAKKETAWNLRLVNRSNPIPTDYELELAEVPGGEQVDARIYEPLMDLLEAAEAEGLGPIVVAGYRAGDTSSVFWTRRWRIIWPRAIPRRRPRHWRRNG